MCDERAHARACHRPQSRFCLPSLRARAARRQAAIKWRILMAAVIVATQATDCAHKQQPPAKHVVDFRLLTSLQRSLLKNCAARKRQLVAHRRRRLRWRSIVVGAEKAANTVGGRHRALESAKKSATTIERKRRRPLRR